MAPNVSVNVSPSPGFCVKSTSLQSARLTKSEPNPTRISVPQGRKVFINIAWSRDVPPSPEGAEEAIELAIRGNGPVEQDTKDMISVFVSEGREDTDKAGKPSLVFDCIYHTSLRSRALKDVEFKSFLIELALLRIESQASLSLSRTLGTPNIPSKGVLKSRPVSIPASLFPPGHHHYLPVIENPTQPLIEEVVTGTAISPNHGVSMSATPLDSGVSKGGAEPNDMALETPTWAWKQEGPQIRITVQVPKLTHAAISSATLDLEPRRLTLLIPSLYSLDIDLNLTDAALGQALFRSGAGPHGTEQALMLKRARDLNVDGARAEWRIKDRCLLILA
ncbi:hypothetical protein BC834DRAFT_863043 [Gloeopeniophorella convolvens]|nr:hypothetical protein BC834DRAFT_863043 [Gloeopeniophorella convolvens]